jgi:hypothetical protein
VCTLVQKRSDFTTDKSGFTTDRSGFTTDKSGFTILQDLQALAEEEVCTLVQPAMRRAQRQFLYFSTSKASKLSTQSGGHHTSARLRGARRRLYTHTHTHALLVLKYKY